MEKNLLQTPDWDRMVDMAVIHGGYFGTKHCARSGCSEQVLRQYLHARRPEIAARGNYRVVRVPARMQEDLIEHWLWSGLTGVFSHETALVLHELADRLPSRIHMTLPEDWEAQPRKPRKGLVLHYGRVFKSHRRWVDQVPTTSPYRTILACIDAGRKPEVILNAISRARMRGTILNTHVLQLETLVDEKYG